MEIAVLGGAGGIGRAVVADLLTNSDLSVRIVDSRQDAGRRLADRLGDRVRFSLADAGRPKTIVRAVEGVRTAINCIGPFYRFAVTVARAILDAGINGIDICDDYTPIGGLLALDELAKTRNVCYVTGVGWSPGITNMLALRGYRKLDRVRSIVIHWLSGTADYQGPAAVKHLLFTSTGEIPIYRDGDWKRVEALAEPERVVFPPPFGKAEVSHSGHPEPLTLPRTMDLQNVEVKGGLVPKWNNAAVKAAVRLGLTRDDRSIDRTARHINRMERLFRVGGVQRSAARVTLVGQKDGRWTRLVYTTVDRMARLTALPASVAAQILAHQDDIKPGVCAPEAYLDPDAFFTALASRGIVVQEESFDENVDE